MAKQNFLLYYLLLFTVVTGFYLLYGYLQLSGSSYVYPLDDVYIHLAISRNFAEHGFWSVNLNCFDSASSSVLYTLLLSFFIKIFGESIYYPMMLNVVFGYACVYWFYRYFKDFYSEKELLLGLVFLLPLSMLHFMVVIGMEQTLHILLSILAIYVLREAIDSGFQKVKFLKLLLVVFLLGTVRFESMFFTVSLAVSLVFRRHYLPSFYVLFFGFLPIVLFGLLSIQNGGLFFPNSVLVKGSYPSGNVFFGLLQIFYKNLLMNPSFYKLFLFPIVFVSLYIFYSYKKRDWRLFFGKETILIAVFSTAVLQSLFAKIVYRYENYVMAMVLMVLIPIIVELYGLLKSGKIFQKRYVVFLMSFSGLVFVSVYRVFTSDAKLKFASKNIQEQQVEMARFLSKYYRNQKVVANDIGAISYFGHVRLLDIVGLGSTDVAKFIVENKNLPDDEFNVKYHQFLKNYINTNHYKVAIIYPDWFPRGVPKTWVRVGSWTIANNHATAREQVVIYAITKEEFPKALENFKNFDLNKNVTRKFSEN